MGDGIAAVAYKSGHRAWGRFGAGNGIKPLTDGTEFTNLILAFLLSLPNWGLAVSTIRSYGWERATCTFASVARTS
jgi:hypothetical protein